MPVQRIYFAFNSERGEFVQLSNAKLSLRFTRNIFRMFYILNSNEFVRWKERKLEGLSWSENKKLCSFIGKKLLFGKNCETTFSELDFSDLNVLKLKLAVFFGNEPTDLCEIVD